MPPFQMGKKLDYTEKKRRRMARNMCEFFTAN